MDFYIGEGYLYINEKMTDFSIEKLNKYSGGCAYDINLYLGEDRLTFSVKNKKELKSIYNKIKQVLEED